MAKPLNHQAEYMALVAAQLSAEREARAAQTKALRSAATLRIVTTKESGER